jgi:hypothetical protein
VIIPVLTQHYPMLQRNLLYTGVTRGKRLVGLVGQQARRMAAPWRTRAIWHGGSSPIAEELCKELQVLLGRCEQIPPPRARMGMRALTLDWLSIFLARYPPKSTCSATMDL